MIPKLKYLAMYEKNPVKAIRYIGKIKKMGSNFTVTQESMR